MKQSWIPMLTAFSGDGRYGASHNGVNLDSRTLTKLLRGEALDGNQAYTLSELFANLKASIFTELKTAKPIDLYRRHLQKNYIERLLKMTVRSVASNSVGVENSLTLQNDISTVVKMQLREIENDINDVVNKEDDKSKSHLLDLAERIHFVFKSDK